MDITITGDKDYPANIKFIKNIICTIVINIDPYNIIKSVFSIKNDSIKILDVSEKEHIINMSPYRTVIVLGVGKACAPIAFFLESKLKDKINSGYIVVKHDFNKEFNKIKLLKAGHPYPDKNSLYAGKLFYEIISKSRSDTIIFFIITGGGSSLLVYPDERISIEEVILFNEIIVNAGLSIQQINQLRTAISKIKGGLLAKAANPAKVISLIMSDVPGNKLEFIASGPTVNNEIDYESVFKMINTNEKLMKIPENIINFLKNQKNNQLIIRNKNAENILIGSNKKILNEISFLIKNEGYIVKIISDNLSGDIENCVTQFIEMIKDNLKINSPICFLSGGETQVDVKNNSGQGGRNTHFTLLFAKHAIINNLHKKEKITFISFATDGNDGNTDAAGAVVQIDKIVKRTSLTEIKRSLDNFDSYNFFKKYGGLIKTGPTNSNFMDLQIILLG